MTPCTATDGVTEAAPEAPARRKLDWMLEVDDSSAAVAVAEAVLADAEEAMPATQEEANGGGAPEARQPSTSSSADSSLRNQSPAAEHVNRRHYKGYDIFVRNLPEEATNQQLVEFFGSAGKIIRAPRVQQRRGFAWITFDSMDAVAKALSFSGLWTTAFGGCSRQLFVDIGRRSDIDTPASQAPPAQQEERGSLAEVSARPAPAGNDHATGSMTTSQRHKATAAALKATTVELGDAQAESARLRAQVEQLEERVSALNIEKLCAKGESDELIREREAASARYARRTAARDIEHGRLKEENKRLKQLADRRAQGSRERL